MNEDKLYNELCDILERGEHRTVKGVLESFVMMDICEWYEAWILHMRYQREHEGV